MPIIQIHPTINFHVYFFILIFLTLTACSSTQPKQSPNSLESRIEQSRVILVGETHTNYGHHLNQLGVIKKTRRKWGGVISIGLEMVQQPFQHFLDDYISGKITEIEMLRGVHWYSRWGYDFRLYRPIFNYAKQHKIPLLALNIPRKVTKRASKAGINGLNTKERKLLPAVINYNNPEYIARLKKIFSLHAHGKTFNQKGFEKFIEVQLAWDEGMAFAANKYLRKYPQKRMVILAGSGHLINRDGIPSRLDRQLNLATDQRALVILSYTDKKHTMKEADFSLQTKDIKLPLAGTIGIRMKNSKAGVVILSIIKSGAAHKADLQSGDVLISLNKTKTKTMSEVRLWLLDKKPNEKITVEIQRENQSLSKILVLGK